MSSWSDTIKAGCEAAIKANATLQYADIFDRAERANDREPDADQPQVFMDERPIDANKLPDATRFTKRTIDFWLVFSEPRVAGLDDETTVAGSLKTEYEQALRTAIQTANPWSTVPIDADVVQIDFVSSDLTPSIGDELAERGALHRVKQTWQFTVNEAS